MHELFLSLRPSLIFKDPGSSLLFWTFTAGFAYISVKVALYLKKIAEEYLKRSASASEALALSVDLQIFVSNIEMHASRASIERRNLLDFKGPIGFDKAFALAPLVTRLFMKGSPLNSRLRPETLLAAAKNAEELCIDILSQFGLSENYRGTQMQDTSKLKRVEVKASLFRVTTPMPLCEWISIKGEFELPELPSCKEASFCAASVTSLPSLTKCKTLQLDQLAKLESLPSDLSELESLTIKDCPQLTHLPDLPNLKTLNLSGRNGIEALSGLPSNVNILINRRSFTLEEANEHLSSSSPPLSISHSDLPFSGQNLSSTSSSSS